MTLGPPIVGFCEDGTWINCEPTGVGQVSVNQDDLYRRMLKVRRFQAQGLFSLDNLTTAIRILWGETAWVVEAKNRRVVIAPGRVLTPYERGFIQLYPRILPVAPGVRILFHFGTAPIFGFGVGWGGFCDGSEWLCPVDVGAYECQY